MLIICSALRRWNCRTRAGVNVGAYFTIVRNTVSVHSKRFLALDHVRSQWYIYAFTCDIS